MESEKNAYTCEICGAEFESPGIFGKHKSGHQHKISCEEVQAELRRLAEETGQTPTVGMMNEHGRYSASTVKTHFDSWNQAVRSVGLTPNRRYDITNEELKDDIRAVADELGYPPTSGEQNEYGEYTVSRSQDAFGSWNEALQAAGFEPHHHVQICEEALLQAIHELVEELGEVPTASDMNAFGEYSHRPYYRNWDGWKSAVRAAGYEPVGRPSGEDNCNWKENPVHEWREYGANWDTQREKALDRDNYVCQTLGCTRTQQEHQSEFGRGLHVHHIRPLSSFGTSDDTVDFERANHLDNLVTVCVEHHHLWEQVSPLRLDTL